MERCPVCRAALNGAETCRRCKTDLRQAIAIERQAEDLAGTGMLRLTRGEPAEAASLLRRSLALHAMPGVRSVLAAAVAACQKPRMIAGEGGVVVNFGEM
jgi:hypothetical protein